METMAAHGWRTDRSVAEFLFRQGYRFDFYQAVRVLEFLSPEAVPVGEGSEPEKEAVRFSSNVGLAFPASDVDRVDPSGPAPFLPRMTVNFMGLAGSLGPLPKPYTELVLERVHRKDTALRDFLDIFNHRLISLLYRVRKVHRIGFAPQHPENTPFAHYLYCLFGLGTPGLSERMSIRDRALLLYTGLLAQQPRSVVGLETMLSDYFSVDVAVRQFKGRWYRIEADQITRIGLTGANQRLARTAVLGSRVWTQQGMIAICLGVLISRDFHRFLPTGKGYRSLCGLTRFYLGTELEFDFLLSIEAEQVPESRLSDGQRGRGPRLGWNAWLRTRKMRRDPPPVRISPRLLSPSVYPSHLYRRICPETKENEKRLRS